MRGKLRDLKTKVTAQQLDDTKWTAQGSMRRAADMTISKAKVVIEGAYSAAHQAMMKAQTEDRAEAIRSDFNAAVEKLRGVLGTFDEAFDDG